MFNRSDDANRVQDILTAIAYLRRHTGAETVNVVGTARAGLWVLLAAALDPGELTVAVDLDRFDAADDAAYVDGLFIPGLRRAGDVRAAAPLLSRGRLLLHNVHARFPLPWFEASFEAAGRSGSLRTSEARACVGRGSRWPGWSPDRCLPGWSSRPAPAWSTGTVGQPGRFFRHRGVVLDPCRGA